MTTFKPAAGLGAALCLGLLGGCMTAPLPSLSQDAAVRTAAAEAARRLPSADLARPQATDLGDRWEVVFAQPAGAAAATPIIVVEKRGPKVLRAFDWR